MRKSWLFLSVLGLSLFGCDAPPKQDILSLKHAQFSDLKKWDADDHAAALQAFLKSCDRILKKPDDQAFGKLDQAGTFGDWKPACKAAQSLPEGDAAQARTLFEEYFTPYQILSNDQPDGLFTGYYEASLKGALSPDDIYQTPLYKRPDDLVMVHLGEFREGLKGNRIAGRVINGRLRPYESRSDIVAGDWPHNQETLLWVDSPIDAFFVQIQGSAVVELRDGGTMRIGYAGQNGHPYYAIGRELIKRGDLTKETVSMQSIRAWLEHNRDEAEKVMNTNASYVFFRDTQSTGAIGAEGVVLTPQRSLAVDRTRIPYGAPMWLQSEAPKEGADPLSRLMIAQDTGGAIRGSIRGDVFWGHGAEAEAKAGHMKAKGSYWILLPKRSI